MTPRFTIRPEQTQPLAVRAALGFFSCVTLVAGGALAWLACKRVLAGDADVFGTLGFAFLSLASLLFSAHLWPSFLELVAGRLELTLEPDRVLMRRTLFGFGLQCCAVPLNEKSRICLKANEQMLLTFRPRMNLSSLFAERQGVTPTQTAYSVSLCSPLQEVTLQEYHDRDEAWKLLQALHAAYPQLPAELNAQGIEW